MTFRFSLTTCQTICINYINKVPSRSPIYLLSAKFKKNQWIYYWELNRSAQGAKCEEGQAVKMKETIWAEHSINLWIFLCIACSLSYSSFSGGENLQLQQAIKKTQLGNILMKFLFSFPFADMYTKCKQYNERPVGNETASWEVRSWWWQKEHFWIGRICNLVNVFISSYFLKKCLLDVTMSVQRTTRKKCTQLTGLFVLAT